MQRLWAPHLPTYGSVDASTSLHPSQSQPQPQQQPELVRMEEESFGAASFQAQHETRDPEGTAARSSSLYDLGGSPALFQDA